MPAKERFAATLADACPGCKRTDTSVDDWDIGTATIEKRRYLRATCRHCGYTAFFDERILYPVSERPGLGKPHI